MVINEPSKGKYYGGAIAAPVFKEISDRIYAGLDDIKNPPPVDTTGLGIPYANAGMQKDIEAVYSALDIKAKVINPAAQWAKPFTENSGVTLMPAGVSGGTMPDVTGMGIKDAVYLLEQMGLRVVINGKGMVIRQSIQAGSVIPKGSIIILDLGSAGAPAVKVVKVEGKKVTK